MCKGCGIKAHLRGFKLLHHVLELLQADKAIACGIVLENGLKWDVNEPRERQERAALMVKKDIFHVFCIRVS